MLQFGAVLTVQVASSQRGGHYYGGVNSKFEPTTRRGREGTPCVTTQSLSLSGTMLEQLIIVKFSLLQVHGEPVYPYESPRRGSRGPEREGSRPHSRGSLASGYEVPNGQSRSSSAEASRGYRAVEPSYQSLPRRLSRLPHEARGSNGKVDRRQSFQDFKTFRDKFTGKLDFKTTLRSSEKNPDELPKSERDWIKKNEQDKRREARARVRPGGNREYGAPDVIESDFDFRSPPGTRDTSRERRGEQEKGVPRRGEQVYATPGGSRLTRIQSAPRPQYGYHELKYGSREELRSPNKNIWSPTEDQMSLVPPGRPMDPLSPRRVEFSAANEVFSFTKQLNETVTPGTSRPPSRCESPAPKSILRHTSSDPAHRNQATRSQTAEFSPRPPEQGARPAVRSNTTDLSFCSTPLARPTSLVIPQAPATSGRPGQSLVQIMLPQEEHKDGDSDDTLIEEKQDVEVSEKRIRSEEDKEPGQGHRRVPPPLADWNRSQSFPPANIQEGSHLRKLSDQQGSNLRKGSTQEGSNLQQLNSQGLSNSSLVSQPIGECGLRHSDLDLLRDNNQAMRIRVGDLERQVHDNNDDIKCLKATLAECLRRIDLVERKEEPPPAPAPRLRQRANVIEPSKPSRRPTSEYGGMGQRVTMDPNAGYNLHRTR